ncbi:hypothetical protein LHYA1_G005506 [Lachnellula hyalina]|uniref:Phosphoglycerate mutase n=1 Tax=Lachnellula hyalina TaxID=1316788 RepID=A0A8H8U0G5_9HELO|nr:uncharacterized protein LHYA1_G005506 [Lachnellula hyalina]TVY26021.1 hypothetical protein LHYA1_G005506 [Lachnellula hyalina]
MGWPPAVVIVVRHGARLDAADKQWHLTSPTPYDPPLTYGGWTQSRALGARIASILRSRETDDDIPDASGGDKRAGDRRKRRHKVIIHTSPFQRCVQTSIGISSGLAQNPGHTHHRPASSPDKALQTHSSPRPRPSVITGSPSLDPDSALDPSKSNGKPREQPDNIKKSTIRVDPFLGEWLTPDYFEHITPPPSSIMMSAGAKADLLRREDYSNLINFKEANGAPQVQGFPGGWGSPVVNTEKEKEKEGPLATVSSVARALPRRKRTSSLSSAGTNGSHGSHGSHHTIRSRSPVPTEHGIYEPPVPNYAISSSHPIPPGYVAHSRDACVDVDYQWDSMRDPQNWGSGGEYGEEWSSMHKRFRKGLHQMVGWYQSDDSPGMLFTKTPPASPGGHSEEIDEHENTDLVLILVTHGAGCNALIGALTNQPVLLDVGMASLTMAVRKPTPASSPNHTPGHSRNSSANLNISEQYEVKLVANTEHLRSSSTSTPPLLSRASSLSSKSTFQERFTSNSRPFDVNKARLAPTSSNFGSIRRAASVAGSIPRDYQTARKPSVGLWGSAFHQEEPEEEVESTDDMILNFGEDEKDAQDAKENEPLEEAEKAVAEEPTAVRKGSENEEDDVAPLGLWGSPRPPGYAEKIREIAPKRRWTVTERT